MKRSSRGRGAATWGGARAWVQDGIRGLEGSFRSASCAGSAPPSLPSSCWSRRCSSCSRRASSRASGELTALPEPAPWRGWPAVEASAAGLEDSPGACRHPGVPSTGRCTRALRASAPTASSRSTDGWPNPTERRAADAHHPDQLSLRRARTGAECSWWRARRPAGADRPSSPRSGARTPAGPTSRAGARCCWGFIIAGIAALLAAFVGALRALRLAQVLDDRQQVREGLCDAAGQLRPLDGAVVLPGARVGRTARGPVVVRRRGLARGTPAVPSAVATGSGAETARP